MTPRLNLIVIRSDNPEDTVQFYELLGLSFQREKHGNGPVHWASNLDGIVLEVYPTSADKNADCSTRLGFEVEDITSKLTAVRSVGFEVISEPKESEWGFRAVIKDPDGRTVELLQE